MSPEQVDGYLNAGRTLHPWIDQAVAFVWWIAPGVAFVGLILAVWCGIGALRHAAGQIRDWLHTTASTDVLESYANSPHIRDALDHINQPRKETP